MVGSWFDYTTASTELVMLQSSRMKKLLFEFE